MFSTPGRFRPSTSKTFFDDTCPLFTPDFMSYFIHEIILPLKNLRFFKVIISWKLAKIVVPTIYRLLFYYDIFGKQEEKWRNEIFLFEEHDKCLIFKNRLLILTLTGGFFCKLRYSMVIERLNGSFLRLSHCLFNSKNERSVLSINQHKSTQKNLGVFFSWHII